ncbi:hypothetical protein TNIN_496191 [Trichonephila inaurata madagascariensis]|uniref:Uncharacterized protein n=1 Tax=Trichonephila inaurata madagascariensis TaxID=2747483 RepID=A0A8X6WL93_9ARAC|nr:hypothetical protein TNIN_496191 [Trichonephila inaurata madagascariensis]
MQSGEIGPRNCQEQDHKMCMWKDTERVRCAVTEEVPEGCLEQITAFVQGDTCNEDAGESDVEFPTEGY